MNRLRRLAALPLAAAVLALAGACANNPKVESTGPRVEALGFTKIAAADPAKLADWYGSRFKLTFRPEGSGYISKDDTPLGPITVAINPAAPGQKIQPIDIFFFVRNLDRVLGQLSDLGTSPQSIGTDSDARPKAIVLDPEGNRIELVQR
jgi:predicted enzyme related to lactoylglutathione lyase